MFKIFLFALIILHNPYMQAGLTDLIRLPECQQFLNNQLSNDSSTEHSILPINEQIGSAEPSITCLNNDHDRIFDHLKNPLKEKFKNILLIINYNHPYYKTMEFLKSMYSPVFPNIVFYGEEASPSVVQINHHFGWWGQNVIADAMQRWPEFEGYLCVQDDCWMNFWNFAELDIKKIWFFILPHFISINQTSSDWHWWNQSYGQRAAFEAFHKIPTHYQEVLEKNSAPKCVAAMWSDFVYIPGNFRHAYIELCKCFENPITFIEIALPTVVLCLDDINNFETIPNVYWGNANLDLYKRDYFWVHPVKFSNKENQQFIQDHVSQWYQGLP